VASLGKVLILDQTMQLQGIAANLKQMYGYTVDHLAYNGQSLEELSLEQYKVLLIAFHVIPDDSLIGYVKQIKRTFPSIQIILVAPETEQDYEDLDEYLFSLFIVPYNLRALTSEVRRALKQNRNIISFIIKEAVESVKGTGGVCYAFVPESNRFVYVADYTKESPWQSTTTREPLWETTFSNIQDRYKFFDTTLSSSWILRVSLVRAGRLIGLLSIERSNNSPFLVEEAQELIQFADQVTQVLEQQNEFAIAVEREHIDISNRVHALRNKLGESLELQKIVEDAPRLMLNVFGATVTSQDEDKYVSYIARRRHNRLYGFAASPQEISKESDALKFLRSEDINEPKSITARAVQTETTINVPNVRNTNEPYREAFEWANSQLSIPLIYLNEVIGVISIETSKPEAFTTRGQQYAEQFANSIAIAVKRAELLDQERRAAKTLRDVSGLTSLTNIDDTFKVAVHLARELIRWRLADEHTEQNQEYKSYVAVKEGDSLYFNPLHNLEDVQLIINSDLKESNSRISLLKKHPEDRVGITGRAALTGQTHWADDCEKDPDYIRFGDRPGSQISVPIKLDDDVIAVISIEHPETYVLDIQDRQTLEALVNLVEIVINNVRQKATIEALNKMHQEISKTRGENSQDVIARIMQILADYALVILGHQNPKGETYRSFSHVGIVYGDVLTLIATSPTDLLQEFREKTHDQINLKKPEGHLGIIGEAVLQNKIFNVPNVAEEDDTYIEFRPNIKSQLSIPITLEDEILGVLSIERDRFGEFDKASVESMKLLVHQAAVIIKSEREGEIRKALSIGIPHTAMNFLEAMNDQINALLKKIDPTSDLADMLHKMRREMTIHYHWVTMIGDQTRPLHKIEVTSEEFLNLLNNCAELLQDKARELGLKEIKVEPSGFTGFSTLSLDVDYFTLMIFNLLNNALKYSAKNPHIHERDILIKGHVTDKLVEIQITNYGIPLRPEELSYIFRLGTRGEVAKRVAHGSGLGLSMVKQIAELHGGSIRAIPSPKSDTEYDNEVTFIISLPIPQNDLQTASN
jgi:putative methionine-R-sulfoxide reductase with GAF domain